MTNIYDYSLNDHSQLRAMSVKFLYVYKPKKYIHIYIYALIFLVHIVYIVKIWSLVPNALESLKIRDW